MNFRRETFSRQLFDEAYLDLLSHYEEVCHFKEFPFDPDVDAYVAMERSGVLRVFTARETDGELVGYFALVVVGYPQSRGVKQAITDVIFFRPEHRGFGPIAFISWCVDQLAGEGVRLVNIGVPVDLDFGAVLAGLGFELVEKNYFRRLGVQHEQ